MAKCEDCPKIIECDSESMKDLELVNDVILGLNRGYTEIAKESIGLLKKRIEARHIKVTGRTG
jgi:hypothetical protein